MVARIGIMILGGGENPNAVVLTRRFLFTNHHVESKSALSSLKAGGAEVHFFFFCGSQSDAKRGDNRKQNHSAAEAMAGRAKIFLFF